VTIGIGAVCDNGAYVLLASDKRVSYGNRKKDKRAIDPNEHAGKQFDFHPLNLAASIAGRLSVTHDIIGEMTVTFNKLIEMQREGKPIYREHVENAIDDARVRQLRRRYNWAARANYGLTLNQLLTGKLKHGKLDSVAWAEIKNNIFSLPLYAEIIVAGYLAEEPLLFKASGKQGIEGNADPPVAVIGSSGSRDAMEHLNRRGQNVHSTLAQTILHFHEAMAIAREKDESGFIGSCDGYVVMSNRFDGFGVVPHFSPTVMGWASAYHGRGSTGSLYGAIVQKQAESIIIRLAPGPRLDSKLNAALKAAKARN
jgi:hypothetical protein